MRITLGPIAAFISRAILQAIVNEAADRLSRPKQTREANQQRGDQRTPDDRDLEPK